MTKPRRPLLGWTLALALAGGGCAKHSSKPNPQDPIARTKIMSGISVPADAVRVEEFVNYFHYGYQPPTDDKPFAVHLEAAPSPFHKARTLLRVGVKGKEVAKSARKKANLVFL